MSCDSIASVAVVLAELNAEALAACDLMTLHASEELSRLAGEHGPNDELNVALEFREGFVLGTVGRLQVRLLD